MNKEIEEASLVFIKKFYKNMENFVIDLDKLFKEKKIKDKDIFEIIDVSIKGLFITHIDRMISIIMDQDIEFIDKLDSAKLYIISTSEMINNILDMNNIKIENRILN
ncbi:MAG TPA: hypothetical protein VNF93_02245 [Buchnera sp. (in: enterobacteria)]|nr:hypothetical protein [Buchnera sp. (in: enterobacteria)]